MPPLEIELRGDPRSLEVLARLPLPDTLSVEESDEGWKLRAEAEHVPDGVATIPFAERYVEWLNTCGRLADSTYRPVGVGAVGYGDHVALASFRARVFAREREFVETNSLPPPALTPELLGAGLRDPAAREVLHFYGALHRDGFSLYKVFELIRQDVGGQRALEGTGWLTPGALTSLRESLNNRAFAGDLARHAVRREPEQAARLLSPEDTEECVRRLLLHWLSWRAERAKTDRQRT